MIALLAAAVAIAAAAAVAAPAAAPATPSPSPAAVVAQYAAALTALKEPRVFTVEYTIEQTGTRALEQTHRIYRDGANERDETISVNGTRPTSPLVRIFRRPYRYTVAALAPKPAAYDFAYAGPHKNGKHVDYVFDLTPKQPARGYVVTRVVIDGVTFLPASISFATAQHAGRGQVTFVKSDRWWVARTAGAQANVPGGVAHEQLAFLHWRFPASLPGSTFAMPRPLTTPPPVALPPG